MTTHGKKLILIGGGGHCKSVLDAVLQVGEYKDIAIVDLKLPVGTEIYGYRVIGNDSALALLKQQGYEYAFITVGSISDTSLRRKLAKQVENFGFRVPIISDSSAVVSRYAEIGEGTFIGKHATINAGVVVGKHCIINSGSIVEHECNIGDFTHISVGATLCGNIHIDSDCFIGAGAVVVQGLTIGKNTTVGANSTVLTSLEDHMKVSKFVTKNGGGYSLTAIYLSSSWDVLWEVA